MEEELREQAPALEQIQGPMTEVELKLQLLHLAKDIIQQDAAMRWETHKRCGDISVDMVIKEAKKLAKFVCS